MKPIFSILTPACWERAAQLTALHEKIAAQIAALNHPAAVEHVVVLDNRRRSVGMKRQALLDVAQGEYVAYVDDDDDVSDDYVAQMLAGAATGADCITFRQKVTLDELQGEVRFGLQHEDAVFQPGGITLRNVWQVCGIRRRCARCGIFPDIMDGEDIAWCRQVRPFLKTEHHIDAVLHHYRFRRAHTLASGR